MGPFLALRTAIISPVTVTQMYKKYKKIILFFSFSSLLVISARKDINSALVDNNLLILSSVFPPKYRIDSN